ncbi:MAG: hypothetical protein ACRC5T_05080 [Cetobacterium sp.]
MFTVVKDGIEYDYNFYLLRKEGDFKVSLIKSMATLDENSSFIDLSDIKGYEEIDSFTVFNFTEEEKKEILRIAESKLKMFEECKITTLFCVYRDFVNFFKTV